MHQHIKKQFLASSPQHTAAAAVPVRIGKKIDEHGLTADQRRQKILAAIRSAGPLSRYPLRFLGK
jgi:hypothetical protein